MNDVTEEEETEEKKWIKPNKVEFLKYFGYFGDDKRKMLIKRLEGKGKK